MANKDNHLKMNQESSVAMNEEDNSLGQIKINHTVIASIVRLAALEVDGVYSVGSSFVDGIAEMFSKKESDRGVRVDEDASGLYIIDIKVVLKFGVELAKVAVSIQENVARQVAHMTMKQVGKVNVIIEGIKMVTPAEQEEYTHAHTD